MEISLREQIPWADDHPWRYTEVMLDAIKTLDAQLYEVVLGRSLRKLVTAPSEEKWWEVLKELADADAAWTQAGGQQQPPRPQMEDQLREEFESEYRDPSGILEYFHSSLDECYTSWSTNSKVWYAPCTAVVQSSGWGKSRVVRELALAPNGVMVFYFSLMHPEHTGYPRSDINIYRFFKNITKVEHAYALFCACFDWLSEQETFPSKQDLFTDHQLKRYHRLLPKIQGKPECNKQHMQKACCDALEKHASSLRRKGICFLFVLDEAGTLLEHPKAADEEEFRGELPFVLFRRASAGLPPQGQSFVLFIDTISRVSNFVPAARRDHSLRVARGLRNLFAPVSRLPAFDLHSASTSSSSLDDIASPQIWFRQGRPLWAAKKFPEHQWLSEMLQLAESKLLGGVLIRSKPGQDLLQSPHMSLVLLGRRIGVDVCPQSSIAQELVASHMSVCLHVAASREYVLCTSLPEPVLNEAASIALRRDRKLMEQQLRQLNSLLLNGIASAGERGELIARFLLIHAMDHLQDNVSPTKPKLLEDFLKAFVPGFDGFSSDLKHLKSAKVFFNAFHRLFGKPSVRDARRFIQKGAAMICPRMQEAFDLYIFFVMIDKNKVYDVNNDNHIGCLGIQVRNWKNVNDSETVNAMRAYKKKVVLKGADEITPDVCMVLHLGINEEENTDQKRQKKGIKKEKGNQGSEGIFVLKGLHMVNVPEDLYDIIKTLLCESPDPLTIMERERIEENKNPAHYAMTTGDGIARETKALQSILSAVYPEVKVDEPEREVKVDEPESSKEKRRRRP